MALFKKTNLKTNPYNKTSFMQVLKTLKEFLSEGEDIPNLYTGNSISDAQDFEQITTVDIETMEQELDSYFENLLGSTNKKLKKKRLKRPFSKKVIYTLNINTENGMKVAKLKIDFKYRNNQLKHMHFKLQTKNAKKSNLKIDFKTKNKAPKSKEPKDKLYREDR